MAKIVLKDAVITIDGTDLSDHVSSVTLEDSANEVDFTGFGSDYTEVGQGLKTASVQLEVFQDFGASSVDSVLYPLYESGGTFAVTVKAESGTTSATNPEYSMDGRLFSYSPIAGAVGDASTTSVTINNGGTGLARAES